MHGFSGKNAAQMAADCARDSSGIAADLSAALFPKSQIHLNDRMISNSRQYLRALVAEMESEILSVAIDELGITDEAVLALANMPGSQTFGPLIGSGLLRHTAIVAELFQIAQRAELNTRLLAHAGSDDLPAAGTSYLDHESPAIADAAMALLVAQSRSHSPQAHITARIADLPAETLHALVRPVAAAIEHLAQTRSPILEKAAEIVAARHDESGSVTSRAKRLARYLKFEAATPPHPAHDGIETFLASLADAAELEMSQIVTFTAEPMMVRLIMVLRSLDVSAQDAVSIHAALAGAGQALTAASYNEIDADGAREMITGWSADPQYTAARDALAARGMHGQS